MEYIILWVLALFGIWSLISNILDSAYIANKSGIFDVEVKVYNQENSIERFIRDVSKVDMVGKITIVDKGSTDNTVEIVKRLSEDNSKVVVEAETDT